MTSQTLVNIEVQLPIEGIPYAFAKYHIAGKDGMTVSQLHAELTNDIKSAPKELSTQNVLEIKQMQELLEDTVEKSEMKSRLIEALKSVVGEDKFTEIRDTVIKSPDFQAITKHSKNASSE